MFGLRAQGERLAITLIVELEVLIEEVDHSFDLQLVGGLEVVAGLGLHHDVPYQIGVDGLDGAFLAGRQADFCEMAGEPGLELLGEAVVAVGDEGVLGHLHDFLALVAEDLLVLGGEPEELKHLFVAQVDVVDVDQQFLGALVLLLLDVHLLLDEGRDGLGTGLRVDCHLQHVLVLRLALEDLLEGEVDAGALAAHSFPLPKHVLAVFVGFGVDVLVELVADGRDVDLAEVAEFLDVEFELEELAFPVLAEIEVEVEDALLAHHRVVLVHQVLHLLALPQQLDRVEQATLKTDRLALCQLVVFA